MTNRKNYYYWIILGCGMSMGFLNIGHAALLNPLMPFLKANLDLSYSQISALTTVRTASALFATLVTNKAFDRLGLKVSVAASFCSAALSCVVFGTASDFAMCLAAAVFSGFAFGMGGMIPASLLIRRWFKDNRGAAMGLCSAGSGLASMTLAAPMARMAKNYGILYAEGTLAAVVAIGALFFMLLVREQPEDMGLPPYEKKRGSSACPQKSGELGRPLGKGSMALLASSVLCIGFMTFCSWDNFSMAATSAGYDALFVGTVIGFEGLASITGRTLYGVASDRLGTTRTNYIYFTLLVVAHGLFLLMDGVTKIYVYGAVFAMGGCCYALSTVGMPIWASELADEKGCVSMLKKLQSLATVGGILMGPVPGLLADAYGNFKPFYAVEGLCLIYALFAVQLVYARRK